MRLSVVIPTHNRAPVLARCLDALRPQGADEVVVVDDASTDATPAVLAERPWVRTVRRERSGGRSGAKNTGIEAAGGDLVLFVDDDAIAQPGLVDRHRAHHAEHPEAHEALLGRVTWSPEIEVTPHMHWLENGGPMFAYNDIADPEDVTWRMLYTVNVSLKRGFLEPFDEELPIYEDTELGYRLSRRGLRLRYRPEALAHHLRTETPERTERRMEEVGAAAALLYAKHPELEEPAPPIRRVGLVKASGARALSRLGLHAFDRRIDEHRAARAFARGYAKARATAPAAQSREST
ncbi:MAG TPA: glycosyltransferase [Thermoleophilaceae bacterium]